MHTVNGYVLEMCQNLKITALVDDPVEQSVKLILCPTHVSLMPCVKGPFFDRIQTKLNHMLILTRTW